MDQNGGLVQISGDLLFGSAAGDVGGTYILDGTLEVTGFIREVDVSVANAQLYINNGTLINTNDIDVQSFRVGEGVNSTATFTLAANQDLNNSGTLYIGTSGEGTLIQDQASSSITSAAIVIANAGSAKGTLTVSGGSLTTTSTSIIVGNNGEGVLNLVDDTVTIANGLVNANGINGKGTINIGTNGSSTGPDITITTGNIETADAGVGIINFYSGTLQHNNSNLIVGQDSGADATFNMEGGTITLQNQLRVANRDNTGVFTLNAGTVNVGSILDISNVATANAGSGTLNVNGGELNVGSRVNSALIIGNSDSPLVTSTANLVGGVTTISNALYLGRVGAGSSGTLNIGDGTSTPKVVVKIGNVEVGSVGAGIANLKSGDIFQNASNLVIGQATTTDGTVNITGGKWWVGFDDTTPTPTTNGVSDVNFNNGVSALNVSGGEMQIARDMNLHSNATAGQHTTVDLTGGSVIVSRNIAARAGTTDFKIGGDATLEVGGNMTLNTGTSSLTLTGGSATISISGNFVANATNTLAFNVSETTGISAIAVSGNVTLGALATFDWAALTSAYTLGDFTLIDNRGSNAVTGIFDGFAEGALVHEFVSGADAYMISYLGFDGLGNDVVLIAVPEPSRMALSFIGGLLLALRRRRIA